jgi:hypothetical protein
MTGVKLEGGGNVSMAATLPGRLRRRYANAMKWQNRGVKCLAEVPFRLVANEIFEQHLIAQGLRTIC